MFRTFQRRTAEPFHRAFRNSIRFSQMGHFALVFLAPWRLMILYRGYHLGVQGPRPQTADALCYPDFFGADPSPSDSCLSRIFFTRAS